MAKAIKHLGVSVLTKRDWEAAVSSRALTRTVEGRAVTFTPIPNDVYAPDRAFSAEIKELDENDVPRPFLLLFVNKGEGWFEIIFPLNFSDRWLIAPVKVQKTSASNRIRSAITDALAPY